MINVFRKDYLARVCEMDTFHVKYPFSQATFSRIAEWMFDFARNTLEKTAVRHPLYRRALPLPELAERTEPVMNRTFLSGEGWLIPGEIMEYAEQGVSAFVVLQPFGCLPNHICGRGVMKRIKEEYPAIQILPLDLEPDTSLANVENRLQMLIMNEKSRAVFTAPRQE
ncbi:MAG: activase, partial [Clostridia bacterium]|nr:activase [Clostridia bacterium]